MSNGLQLAGNEKAKETAATGPIETVGLTYVRTEASNLRSIVGQLELQVIERELASTGWNRKSAAAKLKISYRSLLYKIRRHRLIPPAAQY